MTRKSKSAAGKPERSSRRLESATQHASPLEGEVGTACAAPGEGHLARTMAAKTPLALSVNGAPHQHNGNGSLASLLRELGTGRQPVAVLVNDKVVNERSRNIYKLKAGDRIEVLTFAGGG